MKIAKMLAIAFMAYIGAFTAFGADDTSFPVSSCAATPAPLYMGKRFFFDVSELNIAFKAASGPMKNLEDAELFMHATWFGFPALFTAPTEFVGLCNWWSPHLAIPWSGGYQGLLGHLTIGDKYGAQFSRHFFTLTIAARWYVSPDAFFAFDDTHWSNHAADPVGPEQLQAPEYAAKHGIDVSKVDVVDVVSLQWAQRMRLASHAPLEYRVGYNAFQSTPADWFTESKHHSYPYNWFFEAEAQWRLTPRFAFSFLPRTEFSGESQPRVLEYGIRLGLPGTQSEENLRIFWRQPDGIPDRAFISTRFGTWSATPLLAFNFQSPY